MQLNTGPFLKLPKIHIIIPVLNEEGQIEALLTYLFTCLKGKASVEIIVVDGGSNDATLNLARSYGVTVLQSPKGRAKQMNYAASHYTGDVLYFLHADTLPPKNFIELISEAHKKGIKAGCFRMRFNSNNQFLAFFAWFTRFNFSICRGGDQSLFVDQKLFERLGGYNERYEIYEDTEFITRLYHATNFKVLKAYVTTSDRKYQKVGFTKLQYFFGIIHLKSILGAEPEQLYSYYKRKIAR